MENREIEFRINQLLLNILLSDDMNNIRIEKIKDVFNTYKTKALTDEIEELKKLYSISNNKVAILNNENKQLQSRISELEKSNVDTITNIKQYVKSLDTPENEIYQKNSLLIMSCFSKVLEIMEANKPKTN